MVSDYRFDLSNFTIGDAYDLQEAAQAKDVRRALTIANRFTPINVFALPVGELTIVLSCFLQSVAAAQQTGDDPIAELVRKALESE